MDDDVQALETIHPSIAHLNGGGISFVVPDAGSSADIPGNEVYIYEKSTCF